MADMLVFISNPNHNLSTAIINPSAKVAAKDFIRLELVAGLGA